MDAKKLQEIKLHGTANMDTVIEMAEELLKTQQQLAVAVDAIKETKVSISRNFDRYDELAMHYVDVLSAALKKIGVK